MTDKPKRKTSDIPSKKSGCVLSSVWILVIVLLCAGAVGYLYLRMGRLFLGPPALQAECELAVTDMIRLRIESYACYTCRHPRHYRISHDEGDTWTNIHTHFDGDDGLFIADCSEFQIYTSNKFYFMPTTYRESYFFVTNDAGVTWHQWQPSDTEQYPSDFRCSTIIEVRFQDELNGTMQLGCSHYRERNYSGQQSFNFLTDDGGLTWNLAND